MDPWKSYRTEQTEGLHPSGSFTFDNSTIDGNPRPIKGRLYTLHWDNPFNGSSISHNMNHYIPPEEGKTCLVLGMDGYIVEVLIDGEMGGVPLWGWRWEELQ